MSTIYLDPVAMRATAGAIAENAMRVQETVTGTRSACACDVPRSLIGWLDEELLALTVGAMEAAVGYLQAAVDTVQRAQQIEADQSLVAAQAQVGTPVDVTIMDALREAVADAGGTWSDGTNSDLGTTTMWIGGAQGSLGIMNPSTETTTAWIGGPQSSLGIMDSNVSTDTTTAWIGGAQGSLGPMNPSTGTITMLIGAPTYTNPFVQMAQLMQNSHPSAPPGLGALMAQTDRSSSSSLAETFAKAPNGTSIINGLFVDGAGNTGGLDKLYPKPGYPDEFAVSR